MISAARRGSFTAIRRRPHWPGIAICSAALAVFLPGRAPARTVHCDSPDVELRVEMALQEITGVIDPCGGAEEIAGIVDAFRRCDRDSFRICIDPASARSFVDPGIRDQPAYPTALTWNPDLRSELEPACDGDPRRSVRRDPAASLLHEIVHIVQDCNGLDPAHHEADAVRIENIYRRARGLCQRTRYGTRMLPASTFVPCASNACGCPPPLPAAPAAALADVTTGADPASSNTAAGDTDLGHSE